MPTNPPALHVVRRIQTVCLLILTLIAVGFALAQLGPVLVPFVVAVLLTYCVKPVTELQVRYLRMPRPLGTLITIIVGVALLTALGMVATIGLTTMAGNIGPYRDQLQEFLQRVAETLPLETFGLEPNVEAGIFTVPEDVTQTFIAAALSEATGLLSNGALIFVFMLFMLIGTSQPPSDRPELLVAIESRVQYYLLVLVSLSLGTGVLVGLTLYLLNVPFALLFGFLAFLLNFIPNIGSIVATLLPLPVILLAPELSPVARVFAIVLPGLIQFGIGNILAPRVQGAALNLHPVIILLAIMSFGMIWGIAGAFLATPITAVVRIALERSAVMRPMVHLLDGDLGRLFAEMGSEGRR